MVLPTLSIVVPTHGGREHLARCLPSVRRHMPPGTQVIVVDDASPDRLDVWLAATHPWVETIRLPANQGFARAVNAGIAQARGEVVELLNDDTEVLPGWAEAALRHLADPSVGSVAPLVLRMDEPDLIDSAGQAYHACGWAWNRGYGRRLSPEYLQAGDVFGPSGSSGFYRRSALDRVGGLLLEFGAYYEDVDLSFRLRWAGYRCIYEPASRVLHKGSASYGRQPDRVVRLLARNEELVYWINLGRRQLAWSLPFHLGFIAIRGVRRFLAGQGPDFVRGKLDALRLRRWILERRRVLWDLCERQAHRVPLGISHSPLVLRRGWQWIRHRQNQ